MCLAMPEKSENLENGEEKTLRKKASRPKKARTKRDVCADQLSESGGSCKTNPAMASIAQRIAESIRKHGLTKLAARRIVTAASTAPRATGEAW